MTASTYQTGEDLMAPPRRIVLVRVHGGAGMSTLARLLEPGGAPAVVEGVQGDRLEESDVPVLVARSTATGLRAAAAMLADWPEHLGRPALVIVADAPWPVPPVVRYRIRAISSRVVTVVRVPYLYPLRALDDPARALRSRRVARAVARVRADLAPLAGSRDE